MIYLCNAFSLSMLSEDQNVLSMDKIPAAVAADYVSGEFVSAVGHADTAAVFSAILGRSVSVNRTSIKLAERDVAVVGQYTGPRLPEGATELPEGASITWWMVASL